MIQSLLRLFKRPPEDPSKFWPIVATSRLTINIPQRSVGALCFGDPVDNAHVFGRADLRVPSENNYYFLIYGKDGFELGFDKGRFAFIGFFIGPDEFLPKNCPVSFCEPFINLRRLTRKDSRSQIEALFGSPREVDSDEDETILFYDQNGLTIEFEFSISNALKRVNIYPV